MSTFEPLKEGQEVFLKQPVQIYAKIIGPLEIDLGLPEEQIRYAVKLLPQKQYYLLRDLELAIWPQPKTSQEIDMNPESIEPVAQASEVTPNFSAAEPFSDLAQEINNRIAVRAYELYESGRFAHGHDVENWLRAESETLLYVPAEIGETETQLTVCAEVAGFRENELEVRVAPRSICITGKHHEVSAEGEENTAGSEREAKRIFRVLDLPCEIDPGRVDASLGQDKLEVKLPKVGLRKLVQVRAKAASA